MKIEAGSGASFGQPADRIQDLRWQPPKAAEMTEQDKTKLKKAAADLEAEFMKMLLKEMNKSLQNDTLGVKAPGKDTMADFMSERLAEDLSRKNSLGLQKMIYQHYTRQKSGITPKP